MIYPTRRAVLAAAAVAPVALAIGVLMPASWTAGLALLALLLSLGAADALIGPGVGRAEVTLDAPASASVGAEVEVEAHVRFQGAYPPRVEVAVGSDPLLAAQSGQRRSVAVEAGAGSASLAFVTLRRGTARIDAAWLRWQGLFGLVWKQKRVATELDLVVTPDIRPVREKSAEMLHRDASFGLAVQRQIGEGAEFESLADYRAGMDRRTIDWKQSARHTHLLAKEYRTERNNHIILAIDAGRAMSDPLAGVPRVDRAVSAALLTAWVALRDGDRVGFFGFDSHPRVSSGTVAGARAFPSLQRVAARIDYSQNETNYTLALATLATGLNRRSLIVIFTDFADTITAELMLSAVGALLRRHLVLFVVMRDQELEAFATAEPRGPDDVTRAVTAAALLRERRLVATKLRHLGVQVIETRHEEAGPALLNAYLDLKRRSLL